MIIKDKKEHLRLDDAGSLSQTEAGFFYCFSRGISTIAFYLFADIHAVIHSECPS